MSRAQGLLMAKVDVNRDVAKMWAENHPSQGGILGSGGRFVFCGCRQIVYYNYMAAQQLYGRV